MKKLVLHPFFLFGLIARLILIYFVSPLPIMEWYVPFLETSTHAINLDPWAAWSNQGGIPIAFPYGYVMWGFFLPLSLCFKVLGLPLLWGYYATLLAADFSLLLLLKKFIPSRDKPLLASYWLSPIVIVATYFLGFNDLIPVLFLSLSLYWMKHFRLTLSGLACIAAISAKLSMVLTLPFFALYLLNNRSLHQIAPNFFKGLILGGIAFGLPFMLSHAGMTMLLSNPEMDRVYQLAFNLGGNSQIYFVPLVYFLMTYVTLRIKRLNFDLFNSILGMVFLLVVLMTPSSLGWFVWTIPLLVTYQATGDRITIFLATLFSIFYVLSGFLLSPNFLSELPFLISFNTNAESLIHTMMVAIGIILVIRIWRETISCDDYFRLSRKPLIIGIAGDSGAGKDTFSEALQGLFGNHSVATLSGDDYHLWDRQKPMWQMMTHLNPMANNLEAFASDLVTLMDGKNIRTTYYDHQTGRMSRPAKIKSNDVIIVSGLHALYLPILRACYNLSIYLDIDEDLRKYFKFQRDYHERGHTVEKILASFERRKLDAESFIRPQISHADLILSLQPAQPLSPEAIQKKQLLRFKLVVRSRHEWNELSLTRVLIGICGLHVDMKTNDKASEIILMIEGDVSAQDIALAAKMLCPRILEFLDIKPHWESGVMGLMQLITICFINQVLTRRFIG